MRGSAFAHEADFGPKNAVTDLKTPILGMFIIKLQLDFNNVENLELALKETVKTFYQNGDYNYDWINYNNNVLCLLSKI